MLFAQVSNTGALPAPGSASAIGWLVLTVAGVLAVVNSAITLKRNIFGHKESTEISPNPLDVRLVQEFVRKEECVGRHNDSLRQIATLESQFGKLQEERRVSTGELHEKINGVALDVAGLKTATDLQNQKLTLMDSKLDRIVEKRLNRFSAQI